MKKTSKYRVGQVVRLNTQYYKIGEGRKQQYQRITHMEPWSVTGTGLKGSCLTFINGDRCHEKWVSPLSEKEAGQ